MFKRHLAYLFLLVRMLEPLIDNQIPQFKVALFVHMLIVGICHLPRCLDCQVCFQVCLHLSHLGF